jgi:hypothetical protein
MQSTYRSGSRRSFDTEVTLDTGAGAIRLDAVDISPTGLYLATDFLPEEGDAFDLFFDLPDGGDPVTVRGEVARINADRRDPASGLEMRPGFGVMFSDVPEAIRARLEKLSDD